MNNQQVSIKKVTFNNENDQEADLVPPPQVEINLNMK